MAERRMFSKIIVDSDAFLDMPLSAQALYFHLSMRADDEGFINNPKKIQRMIGASEDDLKLLVAKLFIIPFESGIVVIRHWRLHNYIRADRLTKTKYQEEKRLLGLKDNGTYTLMTDGCLTSDGQMTGRCQASDGQVTDKCLTSDGQMSGGCHTQDRLGKVRLGKDRLEKGAENAPTSTPRNKKDVKHKHGEYGHVKLTDAQFDKLVTDYGKDKTDAAIKKVDEYCQQSGKRYNDYNLVLRKWGYKTDETPKRQNAKTTFNEFPQKDEHFNLDGFDI